MVSRLGLCLPVPSLQTAASDLLRRHFFAPPAWRSLRLCERSPCVCSQVREFTDCDGKTSVARWLGCGEVLGTPIELTPSQPRGAEKLTSTPYPRSFESRERSGLIPVFRPSASCWGRPDGMKLLNWLRMPNVRNWCSAWGDGTVSVKHLTAK